MRQRQIALILGLAIAYFLAARLGLSLTFVNDSASPVWPPTGLAIGVLLVLGWRLWPGVWLGAFAANMAVTQHWPSSALIATGNSLEALVAYGVTHKFTPLLRTPANLVRFLAMGGFVAAMVSATLGVGSLLAFNFAPSSAAGDIWVTWWLGDALGAILIAPLIVFWASDDPPHHGKSEIAAILASAIGVTAWVFGPWSYHEAFPNVQLLLLLPAMWGAFRLTPRWSATMGAAIATVALVGTLNAYGPFANVDLNWALLQMQGYLAVLTILVLGLSAVVTSNRTTNRLLLANKLQLTDKVQETQLNLSRLGAVIGSKEVAILSTDLAGTVTSWNPGAESLYGYTREEILGKPVMTMVPPRDRVAAKALLASVAKGTPAKLHNAERIHKSGASIQIWLSLAPVYDFAGNLVGVSSLSRSLKESLDAQEARHEAEAAEQKLASLQAIADFKTQFLNMASHELRTPLTPLKLQLRMLGLKVAGQADVASSLKSLERNLERLTGLVDDLFYAAQAQSGRLRFNPVETALHELVASGAKEVEELANEHGISLAVHAPPMVMAVDPNRMAQVLHNVLHNAVKYSKEGGHIDVRLEASEHGIAIRVKDDGIGMEPAKMGKLFQPFSRLHDGERPGTGLGLYISKGIAQLHGGSLEAHSKGLGHGSEFVLTLPYSSSSNSSSSSSRS